MDGYQDLWDLEEIMRSLTNTAGRAPGMGGACMEGGAPNSRAGGKRQGQLP